MKLNNPFAGFEQFALSTEEVVMVKGGTKLGAWCGANTPESAASALVIECMSSESFSEVQNGTVVYCFGNFPRGSSNYNLMVSKYGSDPC